MVFIVLAVFSTQLNGASLAISSVATPNCIDWPHRRGHWRVIDAKTTPRRVVFTSLRLCLLISMLRVFDRFCVVGLCPLQLMISRWWTINSEGVTWLFFSAHIDGYWSCTCQLSALCITRRDPFTPRTCYRHVTSRFIICFYCCWFISMIIFRVKIKNYYV